MQHLCAFTHQSTNTGAGIYVNIPGISDSFLTINQNGRYIIQGPNQGGQSPWKVGAGYACGTTMTLAQIINATLRQVSLPNINPINPGLTIPSGFHFHVMLGGGPPLPYNDEFGVQADAAAVERQTAFIWLHDGVMNVPVGQQYTLPFIATNGGSATQFTTVANTWTQGNIVLTQPLPPGRYAVVGCDLIGTALMGFRLIYPYGGPRPGGPGRATLAIQTMNQFRGGRFGSWGEFQFNAQPAIELFASASGAAAYAGALDVVQVAKF